MHELGVLIEVIKTIEAFADENGIREIDTLVLQIGELSSIIPQYVKNCFPAATDGTLLEKTKLRIEILPGNAICTGCGKVFNLLSKGKRCPVCRSGTWALLGGREFLIKEIIAC